MSPGSSSARSTAEVHEHAVVLLGQLPHELRALAPARKHGVDADLLGAIASANMLENLGDVLQLADRGLAVGHEEHLVDLDHRLRPPRVLPDDCRSQHHLEGRDDARFRELLGGL